jgi:hypothetical protein
VAGSKRRTNVMACTPAPKAHSGGCVGDDRASARACSLADCASKMAAWQGRQAAAPAKGDAAMAGARPRRNPRAARRSMGQPALPSSDSNWAATATNASSRPQAPVT